MELTDYLRLLRSNWLAIAVITVTTGAVAFAWTLTQERVYAANSSAIVSAQSGSDVGAALVGENLAQSRIPSYLRIGESRAVAEQVIESLGLKASPESVVQRVDVRNPVDTAVIEVTARGGSAEDARALAEAWVDGIARQVDDLDDDGTRTADQVAPIRLVPLDAAALPAAPVYPDTFRSVALGVLIGALLSTAYVLVRQQVDQRLRQSTVIEQDFAIPVLGQIPLAQLVIDTQMRDTLPFDARAVGLTKEARFLAESLRTLRTNLQFMDVDNPPRVVVVTSPLPGDGKSTVAARLAVTIAAAGQPVVLVDGDLRRPTVADRFGLISDIGLTDVLVGRATVDDVLQPWAGDTNLRILATGPTPPNPSELLGSQAMATLLQDLSRDAMVLIDSSPLLPVTDSAILTARTDGALVVIRTGRTTRDVLARALHNIERVHGRALGVIMNATRVGGSSDISYYDYQSRPAETTPGNPS